MVLLLLLISCRAPDTDVGPAGPTDDGDPGATTSDPGVTTDTDDTEEPSEYIYDEETEDAALHTVQEVGESVVEVVEAVMSVDPMTLTSVYEGLREDGSDSSCPYYYTDGDGDDYYGYQYWYDSCTADGGTTFSGYGYSYYYEPYTSAGYHYDDQAYSQVYGSITDRTGNSLEISGYFYHYTYGYVGNADRYGYAYLIGDARWDHEDAQGTWLAQDLSLDLTYSWSHDSDVEVGTALSVEGSLSGLTGHMNSALLDDFYIYADDAGSDCGIEPSGTLSVRDDAGEWYHIDFQGPGWAGAPVFAPDCDGCGQVYYRGEYMGDVCPEFGALTAWESRPWN